jgi:hypothetical protein
MAGAEGAAVVGREGRTAVGGLQVKSFSLYYLVDPFSEEIRYVGYSRDPEKRYLTHVKQALLRRTHKECWIASLLDQGAYPKLSICCIVQDADEAKRVEVALIALLKERGLDLTNGTTGGDGSAGFKWSKENYEKHRIHWETIGKFKPHPSKDIPQTEEHKRATMAANTPELLARRGAAIKAGWARRNGAPTKKHGKGWSERRWSARKPWISDAGLSTVERLQRQIARAEKKIAKLRALMDKHEANS